MRRSDQGLTLIEVMVALVFTGIAFTALALSQVTGFQVTRSSQEAAFAKDIAMRQMEVFRGYGFQPFNLCPTIDPEDKDTSLAGYPKCEGSEASAEHPGFTLEWVLSNRPQGLPQMSKPALVEAKITVRWQGKGGGKDYAITSYLSCGDPGEFATTDVPCPKESLRQ
ncbi:MAG: prepilin-type N-terminal cleavage/methylation domain-containing protein [Trueperaceae bacterium]